jgi:hypothetical protein
VNLVSTQRAFQAHILDDDVPLPVDWSPRMAAGLAIYRNGYRARLVAALEETFPKTLRWVGADSFARAAAHHIIAHPPSSWTLDEAGADFPQTLAQLFAGDPEVEELAWLELAMHKAFVAKDHDTLDAKAFARATAEYAESEWANMRLLFSPSLQTRRIETDCTAIWRSVVDEDSPPHHVHLAEPAVLVVWRQTISPVFRSMSALEGRCIALARSGQKFGDLCKKLCTQWGADQGAVEAGSMLARWIEDCLIMRVETQSRLT